MVNIVETGSLILIKNIDLNTYYYDIKFIIKFISSLKYVS